MALELGTYIGYSAITTSCNLPDGGKLYGIDPDPTHVRIARDMIEHAGLTQKAEIIEGVLETSIPVSKASVHAPVANFANLSYQRHACKSF